MSTIADTSFSFVCSLTSYWSPLVTTRSPLSFVLTSRQAITLINNVLSGNQNNECTLEAKNTLTNLKHKRISMTITLFASFEALPSPGFCLQVNITNG